MDFKMIIYTVNKMDGAAYKCFNQWLHVILCVFD